MIFLRAGSRTDAQTIAPLILSSAPCLLPYLFKGEDKAINYILAAWCEADGQYSAARHQVATDGQNVLACITFWHNELPKSFHSHTAKSLSAFLDEQQIRHLLVTNKLISDVFLAPLKHQLCVGHLAVLDSHKGTGIGTKLIAFAINHAKNCGKTELVLDVDCDNDEAVSFYFKQGFVEKAKTFFAPTNQHFCRMQYTF